MNFKTQQQNECKKDELLEHQLYLTQIELEKVFLENMTLKQKMSIDQNQKLYYGAAERIKQQLRYRLGSKLIESTKTWLGILTLPYTLYSEVKAFKYEKAQQKRELPSIKCYVDAEEAKKVQKHLSYKLGTVLMKNSNSIFGIFKMPFGLIQTYRKYKNNRDNV